MDNEEYQEKIAELEEMNQQLIAVLKWYAEQDRYVTLSDNTRQVITDRGRRAREVLWHYDINTTEDDNE